MPRHFIYILESADGRYYTGYTTDLERRFEKHQAGTGAKFTRAFGAKSILYSESFLDKSSALRREAQIKKLDRKKKETLIAPPTLCQSFPFVASPRSRILILGSMPGERSLSAQQYYAHPHNMFWDIMGDCFGARRNVPYPQRLRILKKSRVALWDVVFQCHRAGSLDTNIRKESVIPNDFLSLFSTCPHIDTVVFNGHMAEDLFRKLVLKNLAQYLDGRLPTIRFERLPSTSPAHASLTHHQKKDRWRLALQAT